jgi:hypothetical protein
MGKYLDIIRRTEAEPCDISDISDKSPPPARPRPHFGRICRFGRTLTELERRRPDHIAAADWQLAIEDGRRFLARWGYQAEALGWTARDLFGLVPVPAKPVASYRRLSRYDQSGLIWLLRGRPVVALTETTAAIENPTGAMTQFRRWPNDMRT